MNVGEPSFQAVVVEGQAFVVEAHQVQERCVEVVDGGLVDRRFEAELVAFAVAESPFHTGTLSIRGVNTMFYAPKASMPREIGGPLLEIPLRPEKQDTKELEINKTIYDEKNIQNV